MVGSKDAGVSRVMSFGISSSVYPTASFRGDLGDGEARGLGGQGRAAGHAGVHLDGQDAAVFRADGELDVRSARLHTDLPDHLDGGVPKRLVFLVREGLRGRDRDAVAGVHAHGVEILDGADDHHVVGQVPHDLEFVFLPADDRLLDQHLGDGTGGQAPFDGLGIFRLAPRDAPAGAAQGEGRPDDGGKARILHQFPGLFDGPREAAPGHLQADALHGLLEQFPILRHLDRLELGADEFDPVAVQRARLGELDGDVQGRLSPERGQQHVGALAPDDLLHVFRGDGLDVGPVRHVRVGHDGGRIAVDQHDAVAFFAERSAGLGAGIVELAGLSDDDRPGADDQDGFDVGAFRQDDPQKGTAVRRPRRGARASPACSWSKPLEYKVRRPESQR